MDRELKVFTFAALAILMASACFMMSDTDEADAASLTIEAGQTKSFNLVSDLGWYSEPFYDDCDLQFSLRYTNLVTNQYEYSNGTLSGSWGSVSFSLSNLAKAGTGTITLDVVNPDDGEILENVTKSVTITNSHDGSSSSKPLTGFDFFFLNPQNVGSVSKTLYISQGSTVNYRVQGFSYDPTVTVTSGSGISKSINTSHRVTFSGSISADCTMSVTYGTYTWSITLKNVSSGSSSTSYTCYLYYNANGGSGAPSTQSYTGTSTSSHSFTVSSSTPTRSGYTFLGWSTSSSATSASYQAGTAYSFNYGTTQLYAVWKQATITVTGTPDSYGVVGSAWSFKPTVSVSGCSVTVSGANWLSANGTNISGTPTSPGTYNVTLTFAKSGYTSATKTFSITVLSALDFTSSPTGGAIIYAV